MDMLERVKRRIPDATVDDEVLEDYINTISDRLCLRLGVGTLSNLFESICVDAAVKMYRRTYYEGISSEGAANISTTFVDDVLAEYAQEIGDWKTQQANTGGSDRVVRFL